MNQETHKVFIKDGEVIASGTESEVRDKNAVSTIQVTGIEHDEVQEVSKEEMKDINNALRDEKRKVIIDNGRPRIVLDDKRKTK